MRAARVLLVLSWSLAAPALRAEGPPVIPFVSEGMALRFAPADGAFALEIVDAARKPISRTAVPGLFVDGVPQRGFARFGAAIGMFENDAVHLTISHVAPRAYALEWRALDGAEHELRFRLRSEDGERYYGTGERFHALNQRGFILPNRVDDRYGNKGVGTHKPVPFFLSSKGFGVWVDTFAPGRLDLSGTARFDTDLEFRARSLRVVLIAGPDPAEILETFTGLTGRSPVPPPWAFGLWKSRDVHRNRDDVLEDVEKLRGYGIPASVLVIDSPWETGYNDFVLNREQFRDAESMFARVRELGFELALWLTPMVNVKNVLEVAGIDPKTRTFDEAAAKGVLVESADGEVALTEWWKGVGGVVDFTDPVAKAWWFDQLRTTKRWGARAFKCDDGEGNFVPDAVFHDGTPAALMKNRYSDLYNAAMQEYVDEELGGDGVLIVRSGYTGVQKYPFAWAGDNRADFSIDDGLPSVVIAGQNAAMSGIALWGSDIAGYAGTPDKETFIRWTQFATFAPFMQVHMTSNLGPWDFDEEALEIFRKFAILRTRLFPYLYDAVHEASRTGMPVIRPMALAFPDDPDAHRNVHQYLFGPDLLVAPIVHRGTSRNVYVPAGTWYDWWSREAVTGPKNVEVEASLDRIPLFVREGAIVPMLPEDVQTLAERHAAMSAGVVAMDESRVIEVWPGEAPRKIATWDGVRASLVPNGRDQWTFAIASDTPRPVEIRFIGRHPAAPVPGATVGSRGNDSTVVFPSVSERRTVRSSPRPSGRAGCVGCMRGSDRATRDACSRSWGAREQSLR